MPHTKTKVMERPIGSSQIDKFYLGFSGTAINSFCLIVSSKNVVSWCPKHQKYLLLWSKFFWGYGERGEEDCITACFCLFSLGDHDGKAKVCDLRSILLKDSSDRCIENHLDV